MLPVLKVIDAQTQVFNMTLPVLKIVLLTFILKKYFLPVGPFGMPTIIWRDVFLVEREQVVTNTTFVWHYFSLLELR